MYPTQIRMSLVLLGLAVMVTTQAGGTTPDRCEASFKAGDFTGAMACYQLVLKEAPDNASANLGAGTLALYTNDLESASLHLKAAQNHGIDETRIARLLDQVKARRPEPGQYQVKTLAAPVRVPFITTDPLPILKVRVNGGRDVYFNLDTGAGLVVLDSQFANELGIKAKDAFVGTFAGGRHAPVQRATLNSIALGSVTITNLPIDVLPTRSHKLRKDIQIDGIIGTALLTRFLTTIDYSHGNLVLRSRTDSSVFEAQAASSGAARVAMWLVGDHFLFARGRLGDASEGLFMIDTGCAGCGVVSTGAALQAAHITADTAHAFRGVGGGGPVTTVPFTADVTLGGVRICK